MIIREQFCCPECKTITTIEWPNTHLYNDPDFNVNDIMCSVCYSNSLCSPYGLIIADYQEGAEVLYKLTEQGKNILDEYILTVQQEQSMI